MQKDYIPGDKEEGRPVLTAVDWNGPDDPSNPHNFSLSRKIASTVAVTGLAFVGTVAASIYSPGIRDVSSTFNVSEEVAILPLSLYNLGLAFGPMIGAPLSETFGRQVVFLTTTPIFALFVLGCGFSGNLTTLNVCRFFAGVFASPAISNASATITDFTPGRYRGLSFAFYYSMPSCGAVLGPVVGGFVVIGKGWRWTQFVTLFFIIASYIPVALTRETYKKSILQRRAKKLGVEGPPAERRSLLQTVVHFSTVLFARPLHMLLTEPIVTLVCMYSGFLFGLMYTFVVASPWIFEQYYGFGLAGQSLSFLGLTTGAVIAPLPLALIDHLVYQPRLKRFRDDHPPEERFPPEHRLYAALITSFGLPASLLVFAWSTRRTTPWIVPILFQGLTMLFSVMVYASTNLFMIDSYGPLYGASASGAAMLSRYTLSAAFPLFSLQMYRGLGVGWATTILALCTLAMAPIPWLFWRFGKGLRGRSKYETSL